MHEFNRDGKAFAFILGSWSEKEYRLWGVYEVDLKNGVGYDKTIRLEEVISDDGGAIDFAKDCSTKGKAPVVSDETSQDSDKGRDDDGSQSLTLRGLQALDNSHSQRTESQNPQHETARSEPTIEANLVNAIAQNDISSPIDKPSPPRVPPSATETLRSGSTSLFEAYDDAEAHVVDLRDSSDRLIIDSDKQLGGHLDRLKVVADNHNKDKFRMMWRAVNRDLAKAGLDCLPSSGSMQL